VSPTSGEKYDKEPAIDQVLKPGQEIVVQVTKEPLEGKGARVTTQITLPGRYAVLMPAVDYVGISRRIVDEEERERLRNLALEVKPEGKGIIVRTAAEGSLKGILKKIYRLWKKSGMKSWLPAVLRLLRHCCTGRLTLLRGSSGICLMKMCTGSRLMMEGFTTASCGLWPTVK
jgi:hypothetical protein